MNNQTPVLLCPDRKVASWDAVMRAWEQQGWRILKLSNFWEARPAHASADVSCYGGVAFCTTLAERLGLTLVGPTLDHLCHIDYRWLQRKIRLRRMNSLSGNDFPSFVKSMDYKLLPSAVYRSMESFPYRHCGQNGSTPLLVADVVEFALEARALIREGEVVSIGPYHRRATPVPSRAKHFVQEFVEHNEVPGACVVDVGLLKSGIWALVEMNPVWAADPLGCDLEAFVHCIRKASRLSGSDCLRKQEIQHV